MDTQRRLDDILNRDIGIQWFESIAIVQAVCEQVQTRGWSDGFPGAADIAVGADGSIAVVGRTTGPTVALAGHLLAGMLGDDVPVRLRLAINQATATESTYAHLTMFSETLAFFERPGRREVIAAVYARAAAAPARVGAPPTETFPTETPAPKQPDRQPQQPRRPSRRRALVPALMVAGAVLAAVIWLGPTHRKMPAALAALVAADVLPKVTPASAEPDRLPAAEPQRPAKKVKSPAPVPAVTTTPNASKTHAAAREPIRPAAEPTTTASDTLVLPVAEYDTLVIQVGDPEEATDTEENIQGRVYSRADEFVRPPRPIRPQLPPEPPFDSTVAPPTELELLIDASGLVERARLRTPPRNITEFMLVSAAKAWIFRPAELDGQPVPYRFRVRLVLP
jgi:hypothetical protein